jgi:hypothetical protein
MSLVSEHFYSYALQLINGSSPDVILSQVEEIGTEKDLMVLKQNSIIAAISTRKNVTELDTHKYLDAKFQPLFQIGARINFSKYFILGNLILEYSEDPDVKKIAHYYVRRVGGKSIFSCDLKKANLSETRKNIIEDNIKKYAAHDEDRARQVIQKLFDKIRLKE